ncbi:MAG TPA: translation elongation factor Ts [Kiritimatiellia bacterium]|mgnify:CR=1 FL=1|jgi:elongation factor Ts|nr:translation elongation factor Ts [Kiritimatiellia bacterium]HOM58830.1 translation elongation factor Ts [Kiritimatiellia bacterium]HOR97911.1 translation elongation factor Ts [Kiritimatiellia bacterium]HPC48735.1 translation elongation factor Ts [Kiritimatiellia bacterium]HPK36676.1 translation elongation factor Ts [Kiritimatiellia bacterium]
MAEITVAAINDLRQRTNAGMMDCKKALTDANGDIDAAIKALREKGLAIQVKRADKESKEGIIMARTSEDGKTIGMAEVNTETDFVAKTDNFKQFVKAVTDKTLEGVEDVSAALKDELMTIVSQTGENVKIRRTALYKLSGTGKVASYIHMGGKVGVLVEVGCGNEATATSAAFAELVHDLTLQIAAAAPRWITPDEVPAEVVEAEKDIYRNQVQGKPANIVENILKGKIQKFYSDVCLIHQPFIKEPKQTVTDVVNACAKATGDTITIKRFVRYQLGAA